MIQARTDIKEIGCELNLFLINFKLVLKNEPSFKLIFKLFLNRIDFIETI